MKRKKVLRRGWASATISYAYLSILAVVAGFPLVWILLSSVKSKGELAGDPTKFFPSEITFDHFKAVFQQLHFGNNVLNSILIAGTTTLVAIAISALGAYGIVRFFPRFGKVLTRVLITTYMFPPILLAVPYSIIMGKLGMMNSRLGLVIVYMSFSVPYAIWLLVGFFQTVPLDVEEAARVDGANKIQGFYKIYTFINAWNEFLYSLILMNSSEKMTVAVALKSLQGQEVLDWGVMMAASAVVVIPSVVFFMLIQKKIAGGLAAGSVK